VYPWEERRFSIPVWGIYHAHVRYQYVYKTRPTFLDRGILAQTVKEEKDISNGSDSLYRLKIRQTQVIGFHNIM